jgi:hypothetical protein
VKAQGYLVELRACRREEMFEAALRQPAKQGMHTYANGVGCRGKGNNLTKTVTRESYTCAAFCASRDAIQELQADQSIEPVFIRHSHCKQLEDARKSWKIPSARCFPRVRQHEASGNRKLQKLRRLRSLLYQTRLPIEMHHEQAEMKREMQTHDKGTPLQHLEATLASSRHNCNAQVSAVVS